MRLVLRLHLGKPFRLDVAQVQFIDQRGARQRLGAEAADPAHTDTTYFDCLHLGISIQVCY